MAHTSRRRTLRITIILVAAIVIVVTGAGLLVHRYLTGGPMDTYTRQEAYDRVDHHIRTALDQLDHDTELEDLGTMGPLECEMGGYLTESAYWVHGIPRDRNTEVFDTLHDHWQDDGYRINNDNRDRDRARTLQVRHRDDGFSVSLRESLQGDLSISGSSPCIELTDETTSDGLDDETTDP